MAESDFLKLKMLEEPPRLWHQVDGPIIEGGAGSGPQATGQIHFFLMALLRPQGQGQKPQSSTDFYFIPTSSDSSTNTTRGPFPLSLCCSHQAGSGWSPGPPQGLLTSLLLQAGQEQWGLAVQVPERGRHRPVAPLCPGSLSNRTEASHHSRESFLFIVFMLLMGGKQK